MAIKFSTSSIDDVSYSTYDITEFGGVDYTTTPTNVSETRATDISNYLPEGSSLVKRNGWEFMYTNETTQGYKIYYHNIWELDGKYIIYVTYYNTEKSSWYGGFMGVDSIDEIGGVFGLHKPGSTTSYASNIALDSNMTESYGFERGGRLFAFAMNHYVMIWSETTANDDGSTTQIFYEADVKDYAYIPTIAIGVQHTLSSAKSVSSYENFNMLSNYANIEIMVDFSDGVFIETSTSGVYTWSYDEVFNFSDFFSKFDSISITKVNDATPSTSGDNMRAGLIEQDTDGNVIKSKIATFKIDSNKNLVMNIKAYNVTISDSGATKIDSEKTFTEDEKNAGMSGFKTLKFTIQFDYSSGISTIENMKFGCFYGASTYRDVLFVTGNESQKNVDYHTCDPIEDVDDWMTYTYFGDMTFHAIGSSSGAIIGYGVNSDSSLTIIKESVSGEPNVYFRNCTYETGSDGITLSDGTEYTWKTATFNDYVLPSAINLSCDTKGQIIQYDNGVFVNSKDGVYYINVSSSSAASAYEGVEVSYLIRNDLGTDISDANYVIYNNQLWIYRKDKDGNGRVYVCDRNRYTYNNSQLIYEWWVLDNIPADKFYVFNNNLYFTNENGLYKFNDSFVDTNHITTSSIDVDSEVPETFDTDLFFNPDTSDLIISDTSEIIKSIESEPDVKKAYEDFVKNYQFTMSAETPHVYYASKTYAGGSSISFVVTTDTVNYLVYLIDNSNGFITNYKGSIANYIEVKIDSSSMTLTYDTDDTITATFTCTSNGSSKLYPNTFELNDSVEYGFDFAYCELDDNDNPKKLEDCVITDVDNEKHWIWCPDGEYEDLGKVGTVHFNRFGLTIKGQEVNPYGINTISTATLISNTPVSSYWLSKYNALSRLDYLKTATNIYFVPDARRGGYTHIGYKTTKRDVGYYSNAKGTTFDFNDIDFDDFSFGVTEFGRTYSAKKKIKNFSFIQLKFYSDDNTDSTLVSCTFRYKYSKNNKGVK